jgi:hypothetical protein
MKRMLALLLCAMLGAPACASMRATEARLPQTADSVAAPDMALMASYVRQLHVGTRVRVRLADGQIVRGTLMKVDGDPIVVQRRTRIPEPPMQLAIKDLRGVEIEQANGGPGRAIAIGAAAGAGAALGVILLLAAIFSD